MKKRIIALLLALLMATSLFTGCKDKEKTDDKSATTKVSTNKETKSSKKDKKDSKKDAKEAETKETENEDETTKAAESSEKKDTTTTTVKAKEYTKDPVTPVKKQDGNVTPSNSVVEKATDAKDLANVDVNEAAKNSYDTEVSVSQVATTSVETEEYPYLANSNFESHIHSVWSSFQVTDKVKIERQYLKEYLNYVCLPFKDSFYETNCTGYSCNYADDGTYIYLEVNWAYYITKAQYDACYSKAQSIVNTAKTKGSLADQIKYCHDYIGAHTTYQANVDGAYNCLVNGVCDCDGYTAAMQICMAILGVPCKAFATSNHIFNLVQVSGAWYAIDATWDDQDGYGAVLAFYFLIGSNPTYSGISALTSFMSSSDYSCDRCGYLYDEAKFKTACNIPSGAKNIKAISKTEWTFENGGSTYKLTLGF